MARSTLRRTPRLERLESRQVLAGGGPSAEAQFMLEMINEARTNPGAAAERATSDLDQDTLATIDHYGESLGEAKQRIAGSPSRPALAWSDKLAESATKQSQDQAKNGFQSHTGSDGSDLNTRLDRVGYSWRTYGENVAWNQKTPASVKAQFRMLAR